MSDLNTTIDRATQISRNVANTYDRRLRAALERYAGRLRQAGLAAVTSPVAPRSPLDAWQDAWDFGIDSAQRAVLFWDTLRQRGNNYLAHEAAGKPPLLYHAWETIADARSFARPANYALVRIVPPKELRVDDTLRPFIIIDPRAGHGPGIGGFKEDSEVGVALKAGHPVYFVIFFPEPEDGQTLADVVDAEAEFVRIVAERHPQSPKPVLVGNCQGGWAVMMLAASRPDIAGPCVINGAPMSYWSGNDAENPMRYSGGLLGGAWINLFAGDLGGGKFDGAHLVANFENLNPANTLWDKYYHLYANVDAEAPRFLEFERWWGGFYLFNDAEIRWIVNNLFVGNKLSAGDARLGPGRFFDLKSIKSPIIVFASMGDNITPPQQAFNWIGDLYSSTEEIKAAGQTIIGLLHEDIGHLGIFVSGAVAKKEHAQIVELLKQIQQLPPGLYAMDIKERERRGGGVSYDVTIVERTLEDLRKMQKYDRVDEKPFEAVAALSELTERSYELLVRPIVRQLAPEWLAKLRREFHPLRVQRWAFSDRNPLLAWLPYAASAVARDASSPARGQCARRRGAGGLGRRERGARPLPRPSRRDRRSGVLPGLRQSPVAQRRRPAARDPACHPVRSPFRARGAAGARHARAGDAGGGLRPHRAADVEGRRRSPQASADGARARAGRPRAPPRPHQRGPVSHADARGDDRRRVRARTCQAGAPEAPARPRRSASRSRASRRDAVPLPARRAPARVGHGIESAAAATGSRHGGNIKGEGGSQASARPAPPPQLGETDMRDFTNRTFDEIEVGASETVSRTLTATEVEALALAAGDVDGFHVEGGDTGDRLSAQGAAAVAIVAGLLNRRLPGPGSAIVGTKFHYAGACRIGDTLTATVTAKARHAKDHQIDFECRCSNQDGDVLVDGVATVQAPVKRIAYADVATPELILRRNDAFAKLFKRCEGCRP